MTRLALKSAAFIVLFLAGNALVRAIVCGHFGDRLDPRAQLFRERRLDGYGVALLGDSVECSYYVDDEDQTLWKRIERETQVKTFLAATNGADTGDLLAIARHLSRRMRTGAVVFIDITPVRAFSRGEPRYRSELFRIAGFVSGEPGALERTWNAVVHPMLELAVPWRDILWVASGRSARSAFGSGGDFNRTWDRESDLALSRYRMVERTFRSRNDRSDVTVLDELRSILERGGLIPVFVLTPLNTELIDRWSLSDAGRSIRLSFDERHQEHVRHLRAHGLRFIDLYSAVPPHGFADIIHTNASGDAIMAHALAEEVGLLRRQYRLVDAAQGQGTASPPRR
jgi:hypothetical protein